jgi:glycosyltransferase involved in cell wall biosynthesis
MFKEPPNLMPKVTIIIPVYNAEKYLRACLDSIVNQTLTDIQIICVDDGSPDSCPKILDEYAAKDNRIMVIHQRNAGVVAARNAAYPYIKGEYTLFVDNDDEIEANLCEKAVALADAEQADMTYFFWDRVYHKCNQSPQSSYRRDCKIQNLIGKKTLTENDYQILLHYPTLWIKLWRSRFLLDNNIQCPVGQYHDDVFMNWKSLVHNPKLALLSEVMYHYRSNPLSAINELSQKYVMGYPATSDLIKEMLQENGNYHGVWKCLFLYEKLERLSKFYVRLPSNRREEYLRTVKDRFGQDEQEYLFQQNKLKRRTKVFYFALQGSHLAIAENAIYITLYRVGIILQRFRDQWRRWLVNSF